MRNLPGDVGPTGARRAIDDPAVGTHAGPDRKETITTVAAPPSKAPPVSGTAAGDAGTPARDAPTVERILEAALHAFAAKGYRATTLDSIGRAAGVTGPAIYRHFAGKQELYLAVREWAAAALRPGPWRP
jgi:hypothetical protein